MPTLIADSKAIAKDIKERIREKVEEFRSRGISPAMGIVRVGDDPASEYYFNSKLKRAGEFNIDTRAITLEDSVPEEKIKKIVEELARDIQIHGIIIESPLPKPLSYSTLINSIPWNKDVDGASYTNLGRLMSGESCLVAATPLAVMEYLDWLKIPQGSLVMVINRTITVGRPLSQLLLNANYTPVVCHSKTKNLKEISRKADVIVVAAGRPRFVGKEMVTENSVVIDVGINSVEGKITGDTDFESLKNYVKVITPVPGGVGSLTSLLIFDNLLKAIDLQHQSS